MNSIYNLTKEELLFFLEKNNEKKYRATQIWEWLYEKKETDFNNMTNLSKDLIAKLKSNFCIEKLIILEKLTGKNVTKYLFELQDKNTIECVLMKHDYGLSLCISSQVGCNMGCVFCESGVNKKVRDLSLSELVTQVITCENDCLERISHVVIMGIGEPFDNYDNIISFIKILNDPKGLNVGKRHITVSTCGIIPKIKEFMYSDIAVNLAISLHGANDVLRNKLMPINKAYNLKNLIDVLREYIEVTNRRVTFEYIMLEGVNDSEKDALELAELIKGMNAYINLIPYNKMSNTSLKKPDNAKIMKFYDILMGRKVLVTVRKEFGGSINASCGQLRSDYKEEI